MENNTVFELVKRNFNRTGEVIPVPYVGEDAHIYLFVANINSKSASLAKKLTGVNAGDVVRNSGKSLTVDTRIDMKQYKLICLVDGDEVKDIHFAVVFKSDNKAAVSGKPTRVLPELYDELWRNLKEKVK